jgi:hypothetical protein
MSAVCVLYPMPDRHGFGPIDAAILRFAESIAPVEGTLKLWQEVYKMSFNSKVHSAIVYARARILTFVSTFADQVHAQIV